ncbi:MAG: rubredoxin [Rikenellaceae bacterium]
MEKHVCNVCNYIYDPAVGDTENGIEAGTSFEDIPQSWRCPVCGESKAAFDMVESAESVI